MKKTFIIVLIFTLIFLSINTVYAQENNDIDSSINDIISGIHEQDFIEITDFLNGKLNKKFTLKEWLINFLTGDGGLDFTKIISALTGSFNEVISSVSEVLLYILFIGILCTLLNVINLKNTGSNEKNIIYFICYSLVVVLSAKVIGSVFSTTVSAIENMSNTVDGAFPMLITLSEFSGGFGTAVFKPLTAIVSLLSSLIVKNLFIPILSTTATCVIVGNMSTTVKLDSLKKSLLSFIKWALGIITIVFTVIIAGQGFVNMQYNGLSFKILKYATGSIIPIVGGFISGGMDVLLSSAILVKNSFGLILVIYVFLTVANAGITVLIISFILKFAVSVCEPLLDERFVKLLNGIGEVFSYLTAILFVCGFSYILVCFSLINSTALII